MKRNQQAQKGKPTWKQTAEAYAWPGEPYKEWLEEFWTAVARFANGDLPAQEDIDNAITIAHIVAWPLPGEAEHLNELGERSLTERFIKSQSAECRGAVRVILRWLAKPAELDLKATCEAMEAVASHKRCIVRGMKPFGIGKEGDLIAGMHDFVALPGAYVHFPIDAIAEFVSDGLNRLSPGLARLPAPSPVRICSIPGCGRFFASHGALTCCEKHRGAKDSRSREANKFYQYALRCLTGDRPELEKKRDDRRKRLGLSPQNCTLEQLKIHLELDWKVTLMTEILNDWPKQKKSPEHQKPSIYLVKFGSVIRYLEQQSKGEEQK